MFLSIMYLLLSGIFFIFTPELCTAELLTPPSLYLYSAGDLDYLDVIVKRVGDNLTLECEFRGDAPALFLWNYVPAVHEMQSQQIRPYEIKKNGTLSSRLVKEELTVSDSGRYICTSPPYSATKYILVQPNTGVHRCARGAFACELRCVLPMNVCDGRADCTRGQDEHEDICGPMPCSRADRLNCSSGGCIPETACCLSAHALCSEHHCCREHRHALSRFQNLELLPPVEDRHAPDDYGFIQSTIYTVTACALIFMIAVVLLVSALCKLHMKRAALRRYGRHLHHDQRHRFPPCYEASDLLEQAVHSPPSPLREVPCTEEVSTPSPTNSDRNTRLSTLASVFSTRYRQVPTSCSVSERPPAGPRGATPLLERQRLTLQLGRFHLSIPSFRRSSEPRPDTPNVAEINIDDIDFVRLNSNDTYTLNGRTIRLLGGDFENYPMLGGTNPPPYTEAMRYKLYGPPPEYLSRDRLHRTNSVDEQARSNVEMPPGYEELSDGNAGNAGNRNDCNDNSLGNSSTFYNDSNQLSPTLDEATNAAATPNGNTVTSNGNLASFCDNLSIGNIDNLREEIGATPNVSNLNLSSGNINGNGNCETLNSVIHNLPAIDSDVNANDEIFGNNNNLVA